MQNNQYDPAQQIAINSQKIDSLTKAFGKYVEYTGPAVRNMDKYFSGIQAAFKDKKPSPIDYYFPASIGISSDVNVYRDPRSGEPKRAAVKGWASNVDFMGEYDLFSVFGDTGLGAIMGGYLAGWADSDIYYGGISAEGKLVDTLAGINYGLDMSEDGSEVSIDYENEFLEVRSRLDAVEDLTKSHAKHYANSFYKSKDNLPQSISEKASENEKNYDDNRGMYG